MPWCEVCERPTEFVIDADGNQYCADPQHDARLQEKLRRTYRKYQGRYEDQYEERAKERRRPEW